MDVREDALISDSLWAVTSYYNPDGYKRRLENFRAFRRHLQAPLLAVELAKPGGRQLSEDDADIVLCLTGEDRIWQKERLINIGIGRLPAHVRYVAWIDCDLIRDDAPTIAPASRDGGAVEAASILEHGGRFYLFVSFDQCCKGVASTYNMRVGRADRIEGPYVDREGRAMLEGGGTLLERTTGRFVGPGGQEAVKTSKGDMLVYHYYDSDDAGASKIEFTPLRWSEDGWPRLDPLPP